MTCKWIFAKTNDSIEDLTGGHPVEDISKQEHKLMLRLNALILWVHIPQLQQQLVSGYSTDKEFVGPISIGHKPVSF